MPPALASTMTLKRIHREIADLKKEDMGDMQLAPADDNLFSWTASLPGPAGSPYEGGVFKLAVDLPHDYPFVAPKVAFLTRIYHMNISDRGSVCIDVLKQNWSPALSLYKVLLSLSSLLTDPNPQDPLVPAIATIYVRNRKKHDSTAREWTQLYALPPKPAGPVPTPTSAPTSPPSQPRSQAPSREPAPGKGKARAAAIPYTHAVASASSSSLDAVSDGLSRARRAVAATPCAGLAQAGRAGDDVISILSDSDSERELGHGREGKRRAEPAGRPGAGSKRKRVSGGTGDASDDSSDGWGKVRRTGHAPRGRGGEAVRAGGLGDVIVIDD